MVYCEYPCPCGYYGDDCHECPCSTVIVSKHLLRAAMQQMDLSPRAYHRMLKLTGSLGAIANLADKQPLQAPHWAEALSTGRAEYFLDRTGS